MAPKGAGYTGRPPPDPPRWGRPATVSDRLAVLPQYLMPKQALTAFAGIVAHWRGGPITTGIIRRFVAKYQVNMAEAANPDITSYPTFNEFFTRPLKPGARPIAQADLVSPVDGAISQFGAIQAGRYSRPRATISRPPRWSAATRRWPSPMATAGSPTCT
jgi:hypothetical protein